jgi:hypothetical protein
LVVGLVGGVFGRLFREMRGGRAGGGCGCGGVVLGGCAVGVAGELMLWLVVGSECCA